MGRRKDEATKSPGTTQNTLMGGNRITPDEKTSPSLSNTTTSSIPAKSRVEPSNPKKAIRQSTDHKDPGEVHITTTPPKDTNEAINPMLQQNAVERVTEILHHAGYNTIKQETLPDARIQTSIEYNVIQLRCFCPK